MLNVLAEAVVSHLFMCQLPPSSPEPTSHLFYSPTGPLTGWNKYSLWPFWKLNQGLIQRCNHVTTDNIILASWGAFSREWTRSTQWKQLFNQQPWETKTEVERVGCWSTHKYLGNYSVCLYHNLAHSQLGKYILVFLVCLNYILIHVLQSNSVNNNIF